MDKLIDYKLKDFLNELASNSPAPGGGSVAALSGALGIALTSMVCNLTIGKEKYADVQDEIKDILEKSEQIRLQLTELIDKDTEAFNDVMTAFKMPKETEEQIEKRKKAIQVGYKIAANVPLETAIICEKILDIASVVSKKGNKNSITDVAVSAIMAQAGVKSAILNVKINLSSIKDEVFIKETSLMIKKLQKDVDQKIKNIMKTVEDFL